MTQFKKAQVIMLPTDKSNIVLITPKVEYQIGIESKKSFLQGGKDWIYNSSVTDNSEKAQYLYIISDDKIKEGDYIYNELSGIGKYIKNEEFNDGIVVIYNNQGFEVAEDIKNVKKIIATTDTSLEIKTYYKKVGDTLGRNEKVPQPSQQFIEKYIESYNKSNVDSNNYTIIDVLVEYELYQNSINYHKDIWKDFERLKVNPDNTININIKPLKESWNREEVINIINKFNRRINKPITDIPKWIKKNL
jgi:hypothetical protein